MVSCSGSCDCMDAGGRATQEQLPRASETGFPSWSLGTSANGAEKCWASCLSPTYALVNNRMSHDSCSCL